MSNAWPVIFDLDGVLADTKDAVFSSYKHAGVTMPEHAWGRPWQAWLIDACDGDADRAEAVHFVKNSHYLRCIQDGTVKPLSGLSILLTLMPLRMTRILTSASHDATFWILDKLGVPMHYVLGSGCTYGQKVSSLHNCSEIGFYIDDQHDVGQRLTDEVGWRFIPYMPTTTTEEVLRQIGD